MWAQDAGGAYRLLIVDGPNFLQESFRTAFSDGFPNMTAMTIVRQGVNEASPESAVEPAAPRIVAAPPVAAPPAASAPAAAAPATPAATPGTPSVASPEQDTYMVRGTDTLIEIGIAVGVDWELIAQANGISGPNYFVRPGQELVIPAGGAAPQRYVATATDTLSEIGARFGVPWLRIAAANGISGSNYFVRPGQLLTIPAR